MGAPQMFHPPNQPAAKARPWSPLADLFERARSTVLVHTDHGERLTFEEGGARVQGAEGRAECIGSPVQVLGPESALLSSQAG